jgi:hypothetical protein
MRIPSRSSNTRFAEIGGVGSIDLATPQPKEESTLSLLLERVGQRVRVLALLGVLGGWMILVAACSEGSAALSLADYASTVQAGQITTSDGYIASGDSISPFDDENPAISNLQPDLREAVQRAALAADIDGVDMNVTAGWRSARYQGVLFDEAVQRYGSEAVAAKWVATPDVSKHVTGNAVDIGPTDADSWLDQHGAEYGLCRIYANEMWHFELATEPGGVCPPQVPDATAG